MDKAALQDLFAYTNWAWDQIKSATLDEETLRAVAPGSGWPALRNCLAHIVLAYNRWVPAIVELRSRPMPELAPDDFQTWAQIDARRRGTRVGLQSHLDAWTDRSATCCGTGSSARRDSRGRHAGNRPAPRRRRHPTPRRFEAAGW